MKAMELQHMHFLYIIKCSTLDALFHIHAFNLQFGLSYSPPSCGSASSFVCGQVMEWESTYLILIPPPPEHTLPRSGRALFFSTNISSAERPSCMEW